MEALNPFVGGVTTIEVELRAATGNARRRRETSSAVADVTVTYSTPPGADLSGLSSLNSLPGRDQEHSHQD